jgi:FtsZ-binding cell division protein ZapB
MPKTQEEAFKHQMNALFTMYCEAHALPQNGEKNEKLKDSYKQSKQESQKLRDEIEQLRKANEKLSKENQDWKNRVRGGLAKFQAIVD